MTLENLYVKRDHDFPLLPSRKHFRHYRGGNVGVNSYNASRSLNIGDVTLNFSNHRENEFTSITADWRFIPQLTCWRFPVVDS